MQTKVHEKYIGIQSVRNQNMIYQAHFALIFNYNFLQPLRSIIHLFYGPSWL